MNKSLKYLNSNTRTANSVKNILSTVIGQVLTIIVSFITRIYFIRFLGLGYLGINGLFVNIFSFLSLAEMGFAIAFLVSLYRPISVNDSEKINQYAYYFKVVYRYIALIVFLLGLIVMMTIPLFIKTDALSSQFSVSQIRNFYLLFLVNSSLPYLFYTYRFLIIANQKKFLVSYIRYPLVLLLNVIQILVLYYTRNFYLFLMLQIIFTLLEYILVKIFAYKLYPFLKNPPSNLIDSESKDIVKKQVKSMLFHKLSGVIVSSSPGILLSMMMGLGSSGLYSNYMLIFTGLNIVISQLFDGISASIGNYANLKSKEDLTNLYNIILFVNYWIYSFITAGLLILLQELIRLWVGEQYLFKTVTSVILIMNFYINGIRRTNLTFRDVTGLFVYDKKKAVFEAFVGLLLSVLLGLFWKENGIFLGFLLTTLFICHIIEPAILYIHILNGYLRKYFKQILKYVIAGVISLIVTSLIVNTLPIYGWGGFILKVATITIIFNLCYLVLFIKNIHLRSIYRIGKEILSSIN